nr:hypothetical protein CFP56_02656 [Quercus suber]
MRARSYTDVTADTSWGREECFSTVRTSERLTTQKSRSRRQRDQIAIIQLEAARTRLWPDPAPLDNRHCRPRASCSTMILLDEPPNRLHSSSGRAASSPAGGVRGRGAGPWFVGAWHERQHAG